MEIVVKVGQIGLVLWWCQVVRLYINTEECPM